MSAVSGLVAFIDDLECGACGGSGERDLKTVAPPWTGDCLACDGTGKDPDAQKELEAWRARKPLREQPMSEVGELVKHLDWLVQQMIGQRGPDFVLRILDFIDADVLGPAAPTEGM